MLVRLPTFGSFILVRASLNTPHAIDIGLSMRHKYLMPFLCLYFCCRRWPDVCDMHRRVQHSLAHTVHYNIFGAPFYQRVKQT